MCKGFLYVTLQMTVKSLLCLFLYDLPHHVTVIYLQALSSSSRLLTFRSVPLLNPEKQAQYPTHWHSGNILWIIFTLSVLRGCITKLLMVFKQPLCCLSFLQVRSSRQIEHCSDPEFFFSLWFNILGSYLVRMPVCLGIFAKGNICDAHISFIQESLWGGNRWTPPFSRECLCYACERNYDCIYAFSSLPFLPHNDILTASMDIGIIFHPELSYFFLVFVAMHFLLEILLLFRARWLLPSRDSKRFDLEIKLSFTGGQRAHLEWTYQNTSALLGSGLTLVVPLKLTVCQTYSHPVGVPLSSATSTLQSSFSFIISCFYHTVLLVYIFFLLTFS